MPAHGNKEALDLTRQVVRFIKKDNVNWLGFVARPLLATALLETPKRPDCVAGVRGLELGNPRMSHVFETL